MVFARDIENFLYTLAPRELAFEWDNTGALISTNAPVTGVLCALDITLPVVLEAKQKNCNVIVSHHPVIFSGVKRISENDIVFKLAQNGISAICMHTNLDIANGGVNDALAKKFKLDNISTFGEGMGRIGTLPKKMQKGDFLNLCAQIFGTCFATHATNEIKTIAVLGGSGGDFMKEAFDLGADAFVTGEAKHNVILNANHENKLLIVAGHYESEKPVVSEIAIALKSQYENLAIYESENEHNPMAVVTAKS